MAHLELKWLVSGRLLYITPVGGGSYAELSQSARLIVDELETCGQPPYTHIIHHSLENFQPNISVIEARKITMSMLEHPRLGWYLVVAPDLSPLLYLLASTALQLSKARFRFFKTDTEALAFLKEVDETMSDLPDFKIAEVHGRTIELAS